tara:strand:+ start:1377 stop:1859 length:483 start_codon:yes stop_codon:yes gene_type:complete
MPVVDGNWVAPDKAFTSGDWGLKTTKTKGGKDAWFQSDLDRLINTPIHQLGLAKGIAMDIEQQAVEVSGAAEEALKSLKAGLDKFRSTIANDLTSIKASGARVQNEVVQMKQAYQAAQTILTTPEFERAVANAERMAIALKAISELSETKLSVSVFNGGN